MKIGIFDSGIGGLSAANQLINTNNAHIVYVADTANMPYGNKSPEEIVRLSDTIIQFLLAQEVDYIIIACHTISVIAGPHLKIKYPTTSFITMPDVVVPAALAATHNNRIGIMATAATIQSQVYKKALQHGNSSATVIEQACPTLASIIEHEFENKQLITERIFNYVAPLITQNIDTLILGCTHYDLIQQEIQDFVGSTIQIIWSGKSSLPLLPTNYHNSIGTAQLSCFISDKQDVFAQKLVEVVDIKTAVTIRPF